MSTNYYLERPGNPCGECGRAREETRVHIGMSSAGWAFVWRGWRADGPVGVDLVDPDGWITWLHMETEYGKAKIVNEYGDEVPWAKLVEIVVRSRYAPPGRPILRNSSAGGSAVVSGADDVNFEEFS